MNSKLEKTKKKIRNKEEVNVGEEDDEDLINMIKNLSENQSKENSLFDENLLENGLIGGLAKELAEDINLEDLNLPNIRNEIKSKTTYKNNSIRPT